MSSEVTGGRLMSDFYEFGPFRMDTREQLLLRDGRIIALPPKAYETLLVLVEHGGRTLTKDELMRTIWPDTFVEEANLAHNISLLRKVLGESPGEQQYIQTMPRRGYRFVAEVRQPQEEEALPIELTPARTAQEDVTTTQPESSAAGSTTSTLTKSVRGLVFLFCAVLVAVAGYAWYRRIKSPQPDAAQFHSLAVLPFKPLASTDRDESLELGMADTLIARLSSVEQVTVRPLSAVRKYAGPEQDPVAAGEQLGVDAVLDGSIQRAGDRIRVTVRLVRVRDARSVWAQNFDENFTGIFSVDAVSQRVAEMLAFRLSGQRAGRLTRHDTENVEAYQLYLKGQYFWNKFTPEESKTAAGYFEQAIARDPNYALAWTGLANAYGVLGVNGWLPSKDAFPKSEAAAKKALAIDDGLAQAHSALGAADMFYEWDWTAAEAELRRAIDLNADEPTAHGLYSYLLTATRRFDEAIAQARLNVRLNQLSPITYADVARTYYYARRYDEAIAAGRQSLEMDESFVLAGIVVASAYEQKGMQAEAVTQLQKINEPAGATPQVLSALGYAYAVAGRRDEAQRTLKELERISDQTYASPLYFAIIYAGLGDKKHALEQLERAMNERAGWLINLDVEPRFDSLRSEPRYQELLRRVGLAR